MHKNLIWKYKCLELQHLFGLESMNSPAEVWLVA